MVQYHRYHTLKKCGEYAKGGVLESQSLDLDCSSSGYCKRTRPKLFSFLFLTLLCCCFALIPLFFGSSFSLCLFCKHPTSCSHRFFYISIALYVNLVFLFSDSPETEHDWTLASTGNYSYYFSFLLVCFVSVVLNSEFTLENPF